MEKIGKSNLFFSDLILGATKTKRIAYVGVLTAFGVVSNTFFEFRMYDVQFSLTIFVAFVIGILLGSVLGFCSLFLGDFIGYLFNSWGQLYMPWVGLSTGLTAFIAGFVFNGFKTDKTWGIFLKISIISVASFLICTVGVNSTGFYIYNYKMGFSQAVIDYVKNTFGSDVGYFGYLVYRLIFKGQIFNNIFNYALSFICIPLIIKIRIFGDKKG